MLLLAQILPRRRAGRADRGRIGAGANYIVLIFLQPHYTMAKEIEQQIKVYKCDLGCRYRDYFEVVATKDGGIVCIGLGNVGSRNYWGVEDLYVGKHMADFAVADLELSEQKIESFDFCSGWIFEKIKPFLL